MLPEDFNEVLDDTLSKVRGVLASKGDEYAFRATDRLVAFKKGANRLGDTNEHYCVSLMEKHSVSIADMACGGDGDHYTQAQWDEKIIDNINYLVLLRAIIIEKKQTENAKKSTAISENRTQN